jgi:hypothetical protein
MSLADSARCSRSCDITDREEIVLTIQKYEAYEASIQAVLDGGKNIETGAPIDADALDSTLDIDASEFFAYQQTQALSHASGKISPEVAMIVYRALGGEMQSSGNGGWAKGVSLARKVSITNLIGELVARKV